MSQISRISLFLLFFVVSVAFAGDDDYILGLNAYGDGLYSISAPAFEAYLKDGQDTHKRSYAKYLLYKTYMRQKKFDDDQKNLRDIIDIDDSRFDKAQMSADNMMILTATDCAKAASFASGKPDDAVFEAYLNSKCPVDDNFVKIVLEKSKSEAVKVKTAAKSADKTEIVNKIFDSAPVSSLS